MTVHQSTGKLLAASVSSETSLRKRLPAGTLAVEVDTGELQLADGRTPGGFNPKLVHSESFTSLEDKLNALSGLEIFYSRSSYSTWFANPITIEFLEAIGLTNLVSLTVSCVGRTPSGTSFSAEFTMTLSDSRGRVLASYSDYTIEMEEATAILADGTTHPVNLSFVEKESLYNKAVTIQADSALMSGQPSDVFNLEGLSNVAVLPYGPIKAIGYDLLNNTLRGYTDESNAFSTTLEPNTVNSDAHCDIIWYLDKEVQGRELMAFFFNYLEDVIDVFSIDSNGDAVKVEAFSGHPVSYFGFNKDNPCLQVKPFQAASFYLGGANKVGHLYADGTKDVSDFTPKLFFGTRVMPVGGKYRYDTEDYFILSDPSKGDSSLAEYPDVPMSYRRGSWFAVAEENRNTLPSLDNSSVIDLVPTSTGTSISNALLYPLTMQSGYGKSIMVIELGAGDTLLGRALPGLFLTIEVDKTTLASKVVNLTGLSDLDFGLLLTHGSLEEINNYTEVFGGNSRSGFIAIHQPNLGRALTFDTLYEPL